LKVTRVVFAPLLHSMVTHEHHEHHEHNWEESIPAVCKIFGVILVLHVLVMIATIKGLKMYFSKGSKESYRPFPSTTDLAEDTIASTSSVKEQQDFLQEFSNSLLCLGIANFIPVPVFFVMLHFGVDCIWALLGIAAKALVGTLMQHHLLKKLRAFVDSTNPGMKDMDSYLHKFLPMSMWIPVYAVALCDYADLDFDSATAGEATALPSEILQTYSLMWDRVPFIGHTLYELGLPATLTLIVCMASAVQIFEFLRYIFKLKGTTIPRWAGKTDSNNQSRIEVWFSLQHACDASSLTLLADACNASLKFELEKEARAKLDKGEGESYCHAGRSVRFFTRNLVEACPNLWFSVSLLALCYDRVSKETGLLMILSIFSSICTVTKAQYNEARGVMEKVRVGWEWTGHDSDVTNGATYRLNSLLLSLYLIIASVLRFWGVWYCDSHLFSLMSGCYTPKQSH